MAHKRKGGLILQAKNLDGFIWQCFGRPGHEGHHIHPLVRNLVGAQPEKEKAEKSLSAAHAVLKLEVE